MQFNHMRDVFCSGSKTHWNSIIAHARGEGEKILKLKVGKKENLGEFLTVCGGRQPTPPASSGEAELRATLICVFDTRGKTDGDAAFCYFRVI
jgi:hypothetical protein